MSHELPADRYLDREHSWVQFNQRVLELAEDDQIPLLERVRFLAIFASNLDEFFMVRVAGLIRRMAAGFPVQSAVGQTPDQLLKNTLPRPAGWRAGTRPSSPTRSSPHSPATASRSCAGRS